MSITKVIEKNRSLAHRLPPVIKKPLWYARHIVRKPYAYAQLRWPKQPLQLHLGCGQRKLPGFVNIDLNWSPATDYTCDISRLPCPDGSVSRIETYHVIEHIPRPRIEHVLREWYRVLRPGGVLVMECPDFSRNLEEMMAGNEERMYSIFGWQRFPGDAHHWGYTVDTLSALVRKIGFAHVNTPPAQDYHSGNEPCIRVEATK